MKALLLLLLSALPLAAGVVGPLPATSPWFGPFETWINAKEKFGAKGDGKADDTAALQAALDAVNVTPVKDAQHPPRVLFLPEGNYRITKQLVILGNSGLRLMGADPEKTVLRWEGGAEPMLWVNGRHGQIARMTFDGNGKGTAGLRYAWDERSKESPQTSSNRMFLQDLIFRNLTYGIDAGGKLGWLDSEVLVERCRFEKCWEYGIGIRHFNAVNWWVWNSVFVDCGTGVSNVPEPQGGGFHVYHCQFERSTVVDISLKHTGFYGIRNNISVGSNRFFHAQDFGDNGSQVNFHHNVVVHTTEPDAIKADTIGPIVLMDNQFISKPGQEGPVVTAGIAPVEGNPVPVVVVAIGNQFTAEKHFAVQGELLELENATAALEIPALPKFEFSWPARDFELFTVTPEGGVAAVEEALGKVAALPADRFAVVHLAAGEYPLERTLEIPARARLAVIGDGSWAWGDGPRGVLFTAAKKFTGGPMVRATAGGALWLEGFGIHGPKNLPFREMKSPDFSHLPEASLQVLVPDGGFLASLRGLDADALGRGLAVKNAGKARVQATAFQGGGIPNWHREWGWENAADVPGVPFPTVYVEGESSLPVLVQGTNTGRYQVADGGALIVRDAWYESNWAPFYMVMSGRGSFLADNALNATYTHPDLRDVGPSYRIRDFSGELVLLNVGGSFRPRNHALGFEGENKEASILLLGLTANPESFSFEAFDGQLFEMASLEAKSPRPIPAESKSSKWLGLLKANRERDWEPMPPEGFVQIERVRTSNAQNGILIHSIVADE